MATTEERLSSLETKFELFMQEIHEQREDIRRLQDRHAAEMHELNQRFYKKFDEMDTKIDSKFDKLSEQIHTMTIAAVVGFGAILVAVGGLIVAAIK